MLLVFVQMMLFVCFFLFEHCDCESWLQQGSLTELQSSNFPIILVPSFFRTLNFSAAKNDSGEAAIVLNTSRRLGTRRSIILCCRYMFTNIQYTFISLQ